MVSRYSFVLSPLWIAGIAIVLVTVIAFVNLGFWQLRRLDERRQINATIEARSSDDPVRLGVALATYGDNTEDLIHRRVLVSGLYDPSTEVMVIGTTLNGRSGHDVITPLAIDGGTIAVNRGWVPIDTEGPPVTGAAPPAGPVEVAGVLLESQTSGSLGTPRSDGSYEQMGRIDLNALSGQWSPNLLPVYLLVEKQAPAGSELPVPRPAPEPNEGSHLAYAMQWFIFAVIAVIGFAGLIASNARRRAPG